MRYKILTALNMKNKVVVGCATMLSSRNLNHFTEM